MNIPDRPISRDFHISRLARDLYRIDLSLFSLRGTVLLADFHAARLFAQKINQKRDLLRFPEQAVKPGDINAMGLMHEILHLMIDLYRQQKLPAVTRKALAFLEDRLGKDALDQTLLQFADQFPPLPVYRREVDLNTFFAAQTGDTSNREILLEELLLLWLANINPALTPYLDLFTDADLKANTAYRAVMTALRDFFETQPRFGPRSENLIDMLRSPAIAFPHSLSAQLEYIRQQWGYLLGDYLFRLLRGLDLLAEESKAGFAGPGLARIYEFTGLELEPERFSPDKDWMSSLVLIAKNTYVWLDQLSRRFGRNIATLDQIPDEALSELAQAGFTGLWLIGLWERSPASRRIKQLRGNPEAVASAYALFDYQIAHDLGGEEAFQNLRQRAWNFDIRLASDMVPNHMGIDSKWVIEHPDWFIYLAHSPFPSYSFNGPDLSWEPRVGIYLEDHYYDSTDAAVVFKRLDRWSGDVRYIYHGNDGTSMPWNDTAQLNYLLPEVREAVIQTILHVARKFPIIRFDAAMTLARKHYQRLWFPEPGTGGAIPSRAEHGLTREQFDALFPVEFWREVVDRVAQEVPDTLLLAEAFWLMEGYFVRTLGMHRVYNSAFMNMLRDEKNHDYRQVIKNTLEFDPEILKRYVNFMNNPDERTAMDQFGKGDKYFGVCTLLATMPGLPMFGHGQIEGYAEKYGMEFRRAYWDERPDPSLVERHQREIFPLLRKRYLFADVREFLLYDFYHSQGFVDENVFAFSNRHGEERALVVYHNRYAETQGWIRTSVPYSVKAGTSGERAMFTRTLAEGLGLNPGGDYYTIFKDHVTSLEYIRSNHELHEKGLFVALRAYQYHVFLDFRQVRDDASHHYARITAYLEGRGVPDVHSAMRELLLQPIHAPFHELVNPGMLRFVIGGRLSHPDQVVDSDLLDQVAEKSRRLFSAASQLSPTGGVTRTEAADAELDRLAGEVRSTVSAILSLPVMEQRYPLPSSRDYRAAIKLLRSTLEPVESLPDTSWATLLAWAFLSSLGAVTGDPDPAARSRTWIDEWLLGKVLADRLSEFGLDEGAAWRRVTLIKALVAHQRWFESADERPPSALQVLETWLADWDVQQFLGVNRYQGILWYNREAFSEWLGWMMTLAAVHALTQAELASAPIEDEARAHPSSRLTGLTTLSSPSTGAGGGGAGAPSEVEAHPLEIPNLLLKRYRLLKRIRQAERKSGYQVEKLLEAVRDR